MSWDPDTYLAFAGPRLRPALDLVERIPLPPAEVAHLADLGAGPGNLTPLLHDRFPMAHITAVENDPAMLARANEQVGGPRVTVVDADLAAWTPTRPVDVVFSNAALHWVDDHDALLPRLLGLLRPGGALAVQMPRNHDQPSHTLAAEVARDPAWSARVVPHLRERPVRSAADLHRLLAPHADHLDVWETTYVQHLPARPDHTHPIVAWTSGTLLRPLFAALADDEAARRGFLAAYGERIAQAHPVEDDGSVRFPFTRVFLVATAPSLGATKAARPGSTD